MQGLRVCNIPGKKRVYKNVILIYVNDNGGCSCSPCFTAYLKWNLWWWLSTDSKKCHYSSPPPPSRLLYYLFIVHFIYISLSRLHTSLSLTSPPPLPSPHLIIPFLLFLLNSSSLCPFLPASQGGGGGGVESLGRERVKRSKRTM